MRLSGFLRLLPLSSIAFSAPLEDFKGKCEALGSGVKAKEYNNIKVSFAQYLTKNTTLDPVAEGINATCFPLPIPPMPVNLCRVALHVATSEHSETIMETWLPEEWTGRFASTGNGGLAGCESSFTCVNTRSLHD
jgi:feruloyl esterase